MKLERRVCTGDMMTIETRDTENVEHYLDSLNAPPEYRALIKSKLISGSDALIRSAYEIHQAEWRANAAARLRDAAAKF